MPDRPQPCVTRLEPGRQYQYCRCLRSASLPFCDGSHRNTDFTPLTFSVADNKLRWLCCCGRSKDAPWCDGSHNPGWKNDRRQRPSTKP